MNYSNWFEGYKIDDGKLTEFGFSLTGSFYKKSFLVEDLDLRFEIGILESGQVTVMAFNLFDDSPYTLFLADSATGAFVGEVRMRIESLLTEIRDKCAVKGNDLPKQALSLLIRAESLYGDYPDYPFEDKSIFVLRKPSNKKWYALFQKIPYYKLGIHGDRPAWIVTIKIKGEDRTKFVDNKNIFPAFHMNKAKWCSIPLDGRVDSQMLFSLFDSSHNLV